MTRHAPGRLVLLTAAALAAALVLAVSNAASQPEAPAPGPLAGFTTHVRATHYLGGRAYKADHFFKQVRPGVLQGVVFRHLDPNAPVIEAEWAIDKTVYARLSRKDKRRWHPLGPAVDAGRVTIPGASDADEKAALAGIRGLYAQTLNFAGIDGELPRGPEGVRSVTHLAPGERTHGHSGR